MKEKLLSVVIPAYNEEQMLPIAAATIGDLRPSAKERDKIRNRFRR